jgi:hypothetical protein
MLGPDRVRDRRSRPDHHGPDPPEVADTRMTAQLPLRSMAAPATPLPRHLVAGGLIGAVGIVAFRVAIGSYVVGSTHRLQPATAAEASALVAGVPSFVIGGFVHLALTAALVLGGRRVRTAAVALAALAAIAAVAWAVMLLTGLDPFGGTRAGHPTTHGVAVPLFAAAAYGIAALLAAPSSPANGDS